MLAIIRMIVVLSLICAISGFALSYLKILTAPIIEEQVLTYVQGPALKGVFSHADNSPVAERKKFTTGDGRSVTVFPARKGEALIGVALENFGKGFGGDIGVITAIDPGKDAIIAIGITTMKETPGIGTQVAQPAFTGKFAGKGLDVALSSQGGSIDAISGATVSSTGAVAAVAAATRDYKELKEQILKAWKQ